jgi:hypothetical protein
MTSRNDDTMRAGDGDRHQVVEVLRAALDEGRLTLAEYDERVATAYHAMTYADLNILLEDLPRPPEGVLAIPKTRAPARVGPAPDPVRPRRMPLALMILWTIWGSAVAVNVAVWLIVSVTTDDLIYPWPLWVAGPSGAALLGVTIGVEWIRMHRHNQP